MELFQRLTTQAKDKFLKKQIDLNLFTFLFFAILFSKNLIAEELNFKVNEYLSSINSFSSKFIQSDGIFFEEGYIYIQGDKIRLDYSNPERTLKISKEKGVYISHELREEEFFSTKKNIVSVFYDIFLNKGFFSSLSPQVGNGQIIYEKHIKTDPNNVHLKIFFEVKPLLLRKIISKSNNDLISISFYDHNYYDIFEKDFFSFVPIYLD